MKRIVFVMVSLIFMLAGGTAMAEMDTPDEGGGRPGWWVRRVVYDIGSPWRGGNMRGKARPWVSLGYAVKPVGVEPLMIAHQGAKRKQ